MNITNKYAQSQVSLDTSLPGLVHEPLVTIEDRAKQKWSDMTYAEQIKMVAENMEEIKSRVSAQLDRAIMELICGYGESDKQSYLFGQIARDYLIDLIENDMREEQRREAE